MKYTALIIISFVAGFLVHKQFFTPNQSQVDISKLILNSIKQVNKLVVTEAEYSETFTRTSSDKYILDLIQFKKTAIVFGSVKAQVIYDLNKMKFKVDDINKKIIIEDVPLANIDYSYDFKWYDVDQSRFNQFTKDELNAIQNEAKSKVTNKINQDQLLKKADTRLVQELEKMWMVTRALGYKIEIPIKAPTLSNNKD